MSFNNSKQNQNVGALVLNWLHLKGVAKEQAEKELKSLKDSILLAEKELKSLKDSILLAEKELDEARKSYKETTSAFDSRRVFMSSNEINRVKELTQKIEDNTATTFEYQEYQEILLKYGITQDKIDYELAEGNVKKITDLYLLRKTQAKKEKGKLIDMS